MGRQTDLRTREGIEKGKDQGYVTVSYRDIKGTRHDARVLGQGSASGLKLQVTAGRRIVDNVPLGTADNQTNVYFTAG
jgi:hypothetical protein